MKTINLEVTNPLPTFKEARKIAMNEAENVIEDPMLIAWHEKGSGRVFPDLPCSLKDEEQSWVVYARSRGAGVRVEIGDGDYTFIFA